MFCISNHEIIYYNNIGHAGHLTQFINDVAIPIFLQLKLLEMQVQIWEMRSEETAF